MVECSPSPLIRPKEAAAVLGVSEDVLWAHVCLNGLPYYEFSPRCRRFSSEDVELLKSHQSNGFVPLGLPGFGLTARQMPGFVYFAQSGSFVKIGYTGNVQRRLAGLQVAVPKPISLIFSCPGTPELEKSFHRKFFAYRMAGEWFRYSKAIKAWIEALRIAAA